MRQVQVGHSGHYWLRSCRLVVMSAITFATVALALLSPPAACASVNPTDIALGYSLESSASLKAYAPDVTAPAGIVRTSSGRVLWSRGATKRMAPASTTKLMTTLVVMKSLTSTDVASVDQTATTLNGSKVGLVAGKSYTVKSLTEGMLVSSGCDAAYTLAVRVAGSEAAFVRRMNAEAARLGLTNTHYMNSTGLDAPGACTSPADLAKLLSENMKSAEFRRIVRLSSVKIEGRTFPATNLLLAGYPGCIGGKTGTTTIAGHSIVTRAVRNGVDVTVVVMGASTDLRRYQDAARLLDWGVLHATPDVRASYTTVFAPTSAARVSNIKLATTALNNAVVTPGLSASFNSIVGQRTTTRGYLSADAIVGGSVVKQVGGGVCQVSTTAFNTALVAGLPIVQRSPHSMYLSNYPLGRDATVSWTSPDLRFSNNTSDTIVIKSLSSSFSTTVGFAGLTNPSFATMSATPLAQYAAAPVSYVKDTSLATGVTRVLVSGQPGLTTTVTRRIYRGDGTLASSSSFASKYPPITRVIAVGP